MANQLTEDTSDWFNRHISYSDGFFLVAVAPIPNTEILVVRVIQLGAIVDSHAVRVVATLLVYRTRPILFICCRAPSRTRVDKGGQGWTGVDSG